MPWAQTRIVSCGAVLAIAGCSGTTVTPLQPEAFISRPGMENGIVTRQADQNGTLVYGELHAPILPEEYAKPIPSSTPGPRLPARQVLATTRALQDVPAEPNPFPTTPTSAPGVANNYQIVGTVIAEVNGKPIYADKILAELDQQLAADARRMGPAEFRASAQQKIIERVRATIEDQQYLAAANEYLSAESKAQADNFGIMWRFQQVSAAGGSLQQAREKAMRETGLSLDELVQNQRDQALIQILIEQRVQPLIQVTASDKRQYYQQHIAEYTQTAEAKFHLIKIDVARRGGPDEAAKVLQTVMGKLRARTSFEEVSRQYNDDPSNGVVAGGGWVQKGSYVNEDVESAVWKLSPGEFTDPPVQVRSQNAYYIAWLDAKKNGNVQPFEDIGVQVQIENTLRNKQYQDLRQGLTETLLKQSVTTPKDGWQNAIMAMVMQRYAMWTQAR